MIKADLHNHLGRNGANPGFDETIDFTYRRLGQNSIFGIANSNDFRYEKFVDQKGGKYNRQPITSGKRAIYVPEKSMLVVKCQEIFSRQGHLLAIAMPYGKSIILKEAKYSINEARNLGAIVDAVHPFYKAGIGEFLKENLKYLFLFSTFEIGNGSAIWIPGYTPINANKKALDFYNSRILGEFDVGMSASNDGHSVRVIGKCYTMLSDFDLTSKVLPEKLDFALREVKSVDRLHTESNYFDALKHFKNMTLTKAGLLK